MLANVFDHLPASSRDEDITELLSRKEARIERIVSSSQSTPVDAPYDQDRDEWVLLLRGAAGLWIDGEGERTPGLSHQSSVATVCLRRCDVMLDPS